MLRQLVTGCIMMMMYCSTPSSSPRTDADSSARRLVSPRPPRRTYIARGLTGRIYCPVKDDPPDRLVIWSRRGRVIQLSDDSASRRFTVQPGGILVVEDVQPSDAGDYRCTLYSPNDDADRLSFGVRVAVKGKCF